MDSKVFQMVELNGSMQMSHITMINDAKKGIRNTSEPLIDASLLSSNIEAMTQDKYPIEKYAGMMITGTSHNLGGSKSV